MPSRCSSHSRCHVEPDFSVQLDDRQFVLSGPDEDIASVLCEYLYLSVAVHEGEAFYAFIGGRLEIAVGVER